MNSNLLIAMAQCIASCEQSLTVVDRTYDMLPEEEQQFLDSLKPPYEGHLSDFIRDLNEFRMKIEAGPNPNKFKAVNQISIVDVFRADVSVETQNFLEHYCLTYNDSHEYKEHLYRLNEEAEEGVEQYAPREKKEEILNDIAALRELCDANGATYLRLVETA